MATEAPEIILQRSMSPPQFLAATVNASFAGGSRNRHKKQNRETARSAARVLPMNCAAEMASLFEVARNEGLQYSRPGSVAGGSPTWAAYPGRLMGPA